MLPLKMSEKMSVPLMWLWWERSSGKFDVSQFWFTHQLKEVENGYWLVVCYHYFVVGVFAAAATAAAASSI